MMLSIFNFPKQYDMKMVKEYKNRFFKVLFFEHEYLTYYFEPKYKTLGSHLKHSFLVKRVSNC